MAALDFPDTPAVGDTYGSAGVTWRWDGARWGVAPGTTPGPWTTATLSGSWTHNANEPVQYRKNGDRTEWRGRANIASASTATVLVVVSGFRPPFDQPVPMACVIPAGPAWTTGVMYWQANGTVGILTAAVLGVSFNGMSYSTLAAA